MQSTSAAVLLGESGLEAAGSQRTCHRCLSTVEQDGREGDIVHCPGELWPYAKWEDACFLLKTWP